MAIMSALLAVGLNNNYQVVSAVAIISFIVSRPFSGPAFPIKLRLPGIVLNRPGTRTIPFGVRNGTIPCHPRTIFPIALLQLDREFCRRHPLSSAEKRVFYSCGSE